MKDNETLNKEKLAEARRKYFSIHSNYYPDTLNASLNVYANAAINESFNFSALSVMVPYPPNDRYFCEKDYIIDKQNREDFELVRPLLENRLRELAAKYEQFAMREVTQSCFIYTYDILRFKLPADNPKFAGHEYGVITSGLFLEGIKKYFTRPFATSLVRDFVDHTAYHFQVQFIQTP